MVILDRYSISNTLGDKQGKRFGINYLAIDCETGEEVVLKVIEKKAKNEIALQRLLNESNFTFQKKGLPKIISLIELETQLILVKRFESGVNMDVFWRTVRKKNRLSVLKDISNQLIELFSELEKTHTVHCDIKPSNLLIDPSTNQLSLIDFGLAINNQSLEKRKMLFPLGYAAPELLLNFLSIVDQRTDLYAFSILIWRLFDGNLPLTHSNPSVYTNLQLTHPLPKSSRITNELYLILLKASNKHVFAIPPNQLDSVKVKQHLINAMDERYSSFAEMNSAIQAIPETKSWLPKNIFAVPKIKVK